MEAHSQNPGADPERARAFSDLRRHNDYSARIARMLESERQRRIEQVIKAHRKHRTHQAR